MFVKFFIHRPIFATCIALVIVVAGVVCIPLLPVAQFPQIAPPVVQVQANYTGASAEVVEQTTTLPLEQQINGVEGMTYMSSQSSNDGTSTINVTFEVGYDLDIAAVDVQNKVSVAQPQVPEDVRRFGITVQKQSTDFILVVSLLSNVDEYDGLYLSNYAAINIVDVLKRIPGAGTVQILGERKYSMRFWLDPDKLTSMALTAQDVINAVRDQNVQVAAGGIGDPPSPKDQAFQYTITTKGRLDNVDEFENIIVRTRPDGAVVRMKDVARVELGAENYRWFTDLSGRESASVGVYQLPGANAVEVADAVMAKMEELAERFPPGIEYKIPYDTTMFVRESLKEVVITLIIAIFLVIGVIFIFLQDWRATLIPAVTIPVSLIGTFGIMMAFGFSTNTLSMFGLVLAIGIVVDDAIVVVENVSRLIDQEGLSPREAAVKAMGEVTSPIIATTLVLFAVFVPVAFMPGITGQFYRQFALTIAFSVGISSINALTLSPALSGLILRKQSEHKWWFFEKFNKGFDWARHRYDGSVELFMQRWKWVIAAFVALLFGAWWLFGHVPTGFVPEEDQGYFYVLMQSAEGTSLDRSSETLKEIEEYAKNMDGVEDVITIGGYNIISQIVESNSGTLIVVLKNWDERQDPDLHIQNIIARINKHLRLMTDALAFSFNAPPIMGLGTAGGFQFELQDYTGGDLTRLNDVSERMIAAARKYPELGQLSSTFKVNYPQYYVDLDRTKAKTLGVAITDVFNVLQTFLGSLYVNDFNKFGRVYRVYAQAEKDYRSDVSDISKLYVRAQDGSMVPLSTLVKVDRIRGIQTVKHYNLYRTIELTGEAAPGRSSGEAIAAMEKLADEVLPEGFGYEWTGTAFEEKKAAGLAPLVFGLALIFVYLFLAAQYESWSLPLVIMFSVPLALLGALVAQKLRGLVNDIYCQIGLVMLIGLASKNAILLVEFSKELHEKGRSTVEAAREAARLRLRPILMTAFSFILGIVPLLIATGAGAASRRSLGTAVFGGMVAATCLSLVMVPVLYVVIQTLAERGLGFSHPRGFVAAIKEKAEWVVSYLRVRKEIPPEPEDEPEY
jgi:hydrophobe/amphiphile efflux-1 (HAE1) family protein